MQAGVPEMAMQQGKGAPDQIRATPVADRSSASFKCIETSNLAVVCHGSSLA
jgi:hypothetical protein